MKQFDFGKNWQSYAKMALTPKRARAAEGDFLKLLEGIHLKGAAFLDIGFGQGLSLLAAARAGAMAAGNDINPKCRQALDISARFFPELDLRSIPLVIGSILHAPVLEELRALAPDPRGFDIVHSWGVLHHTGDMETAIKHAASLVRPGGHLVLAIYNRHWTSPVWTLIKRTYVSSPARVQKGLVLGFTPVIWTAKLLVSGRDPRRQSRGMDFMHDVVDWVGGYPYEYASKKKINRILSTLDFTMKRFIPAQVPTGCNEFVFLNTGSPS